MSCRDQADEAPVSDARDKGRCDVVSTASRQGATADLKRSSSASEACATGVLHKCFPHISSTREMLHRREWDETPAKRRSKELAISTL